MARERLSTSGSWWGDREGFRPLGIVGLLSQHSPDVEPRSVTCFAPASAIVALSQRWRFRNGDSDAGVRHLPEERASTDQIYDGAMAIAFNLMKTLCGAKWQPSGDPVLPCRTRGSGTLPRFFKVPLRFDAERTALVFPATWLDQPCMVSTRSCAEF